MPSAMVNNVELYYEETGSGDPLIFSHEFGGDGRNWEPQVRFFSRRYRVITYDHRGYPPSEVPAALARRCWLAVQHSDRLDLNQPVG